MEKFIEFFAEQFDELHTTLTPETRFRELEEWSSLVALLVITMVDEEYDVTLKGDDIRNAVTIEDLYNVVKSKI